MSDDPPLPTIDEAIGFVAERLRENRRGWEHMLLEENGYDVFIDRAVQAWLIVEDQRKSSTDPRDLRASPRAQYLSPVFLDAAWELCRRGILRPTTRDLRARGARGERGFSLTIDGREWVQSGSAPLSTDAMARVLAGQRDRFGEAFAQRADEAVKCLRAGTYLAACAMAGAAAESILLALAEAQMGDRDKVHDIYQRRSGRKALVERVTGQWDKENRKRFEAYVDLISYWRDDAAHGKPSELGYAHASLALDRLLHLAGFVSGDWDRLTAPRSSET